ncbi:hypothetical protein B9Z55_018344 [Caenorhabditis nigoni]|uniref:Uncharacterized protein n=1 Tax=Caenorhabditis nigoni TaxID=1611254 RepID=A0A2G5TDN6_9PELO|nr:hypothetical protein B9Z55_018344 [Caenorhabditis nigoni]
MCANVSLIARIPDPPRDGDVDFFNEWILCGLLLFSTVFLIHEGLSLILPFRKAKHRSFARRSLMTRIYLLTEMFLNLFQAMYCLYKLSTYQDDYILTLTFQVFASFTFILTEYFSTVITTSMVVIAILIQITPGKRNKTAVRQRILTVFQIVSCIVLLKEASIFSFLFMHLGYPSLPTLILHYHAVQLLPYYMAFHGAALPLLGVAVFVKYLPEKVPWNRLKTAERKIITQVQILAAVKLAIMMNIVMFTYYGASDEAMMSSIVVTDIFLLPCTIRCLEVHTQIRRAFKGKAAVSDVPEMKSLA